MDSSFFSSSSKRRYGPWGSSHNPQRFKRGVSSLDDDRSLLRRPLKRPKTADLDCRGGIAPPRGSAASLKGADEPPRASSSVKKDGFVRSSEKSGSFSPTVDEPRTSSGKKDCFVRSLEKSGSFSLTTADKLRTVSAKKDGFVTSLEKSGSFSLSTANEPRTSSAKKDGFVRSLEKSRSFSPTAVDEPHTSSAKKDGFLTSLEKSGSFSLSTVDEPRAFSAKKDGFVRSLEKSGSFSPTSGADYKCDSGRRTSEGGKMQGFSSSVKKPDLGTVDHKQKIDHEWNERPSKNDEQDWKERPSKNNEQDARKHSSGSGFRDDYLKRRRPSTAAYLDREDGADASVHKRSSSVYSDSSIRRSRISSEKACFKRIIKLKTKHPFGVDFAEATKDSNFNGVKIKEEEDNYTSPPSKANNGYSDEPFLKSFSTVRTSRVQKPSAKLIPSELSLLFLHVTRKARSERRRDDSAKGKSSKVASIEGFGEELEEALLKNQETELIMEETQKGMADLQSCTPADVVVQENSNTMPKAILSEEAEEREEGEFEPEDEIDERDFSEGKGNHAGNGEGSKLDVEKTSQASEDLKREKGCEQASKCERRLCEQPSSHTKSLSATAVDVNEETKKQDYDDPDTGRSCKEALACTEVCSEQSRQTTTLPCAVNGGKATIESAGGQNASAATSVDAMNKRKQKNQVDKAPDYDGQDHVHLSAVELNSCICDPSSNPQQTSMKLHGTVDEFLENNKVPIPVEPTEQKWKLHENVESRCDLSNYPKDDFLQLSLGLPVSFYASGSSTSAPNRPSDNEVPQVMSHAQCLSHLQTETVPNRLIPSLSLPSFVHDSLQFPHPSSPGSQELSCDVTRNLEKGQWAHSGGKGHFDANKSGMRMDSKPGSPLHSEILQDGKLLANSNGLPPHAIRLLSSGSNQAINRHGEITLGEGDIALQDRVNITACEGPSFGQRSISERSKTKTRQVENLSNVKIGLFELASEPVAAMAQRLQELPDSFLEGLKGLVQELLGNFAKREEFLALQQVLKNRSDLTEETLLRAHFVQLEILVALKTGMQSFVQQGAKSLTYKALIEIFLQTRCRNVDCQQLLPVDDCECKICSEKKGFCHVCMCVVCSKFDSDSNTTRWVGCDVCMHWCHTDCGLRMSHIKSTLVSRNELTSSEMQFQCFSCDHYMELCGFVKGVFENFARTWGAESLTRELDCVRRIFHESKDAKGKQLCQKAEQMLQRLERNDPVRDVCDSMLQFFSENGAQKMTADKASPVMALKKESDEMEGPIEDTNKVFAIMSSLVARKLNHLLEEKGMEQKQMRSAETEKNRLGNCDGYQDLQSIIGAKLTDVLMYQAQADAAREDAVNLQHIIAFRKRKLLEDCHLKSAKSKLDLLEEQQRKHLKELQDLEKSHHQYEYMKSRIETDMKHLMMTIMDKSSQQLI